MFEFLIVIGLVMAYYGYAVSTNPRMWGDQGKDVIQEKNWKEYRKRNGKFFLYSGILLSLLAVLDSVMGLSSLLFCLILLGGEAYLYYPLGKWMKEHEGTWNAWPKHNKKNH